MKTRKQYALNRLFNFLIVLAMFFAFMSIELFLDGEIAWGIGFGIATLLLIILPAIFTPFCYAFDSEGVSLCYVFLPVERYLWKDIHAIEVENKHISGRQSLIELFFSYVFSINGNNVGKRRFYMEGHIRKSFRTKQLLEKYWDGTITGYLLEDAKGWLNKRKAKKLSSLSTDEVASMERETKAEAKEWLKPFAEQAKQHGLCIKSSYFYVTKDLDELKSRPQEEYTYTLIAEISHFNETDENRIVVVSVDLLYVRLGKASYRGVKNEHAKEELHFTITDVLNEINENGIEAYCKDN